MIIRWAHLSDLHHLYKNYETTIMRGSFLEYISKLKHKIDVIFLTGDLTHQGNAYDSTVVTFLDEIIAKTEIDKKNVFCIPGNHDIKRSRMSDRIIESILKSPDARKELNELDEESFKTLLSGQQPFFDFYKSFFGEEYPSEALHFVKKCDGFNVIHINTSLISGKKGVEGNILVGLQKLHETLADLPDDNSVNIAIGHHTINCIHLLEKQSLLNRFSDKKVDLYLNGHVHKANYHSESNNYNHIHMFTSGSIMVDDYADAAFLTGYVDTDSGNGEVEYHKWNSSGEFWYLDPSVGRMTADGSYKFTINRLKKNALSYSPEEKILPVDEDEFKNFIIDFHNVLDKGQPEGESPFVKKDITDKFINMICSATIEKQFDNCSVFFPIVNLIMGSSAFIGFDKKFIIPNVIITEYTNHIHTLSNGDAILNRMIEELYQRYRSSVEYSGERLKLYIKILIFWTIHECDIFNEDLRKLQKEVVAK